MAKQPLYVLVANLSKGPLWGNYAWRYVLPGEEPHTYDTLDGAVEGLACVLGEDPRHSPESLTIFKLEAISPEATLQVWEKARRMLKEEEETL